MTNDADESRKADLIAKARHQMAAITSEFQRGLSAVKDPEQRRQLTSAYLEMIQKYLAKAQDSLSSYRGKRQPAAAAEPSGQSPTDQSDTDQQPPTT